MNNPQKKVLSKFERLLLILCFAPWFIGALTIVARRNLPDTIVYSDNLNGTNQRNTLSGTTRTVTISETRAVIENLQIEFVNGNTNKVWISCAGLTVRNTSTSDAIYVTTVNTTADISASVGADGPDKSGLDSASAWRSIWVISKLDGTTDALISNAIDDKNTSSLPLNLPSSYVYWRRVGWFRNNSSSNMLAFCQFNQYQSFQNGAFTNNKVLTSGAATVTTPVDCSSFCPPTSRIVYIGIDALGTSNLNRLNTSIDSVINHTATLGLWFNFLQSNSPDTTFQLQQDINGSTPLSFDQKMQYRGNSADLRSTIWVIGYEDNL